MNKTNIINYWSYNKNMVPNKIIIDLANKYSKDNNLDLKSDIDIIVNYLRIKEFFSLIIKLSDYYYYISLLILCNYISQLEATSYIYLV